MIKISGNDIRRGGLFLLLFVLINPSFVQASSINPIESFDNLNSGELVGQHGWFGSTGFFSVQNSVVASGSKAARGHCSAPCPPSGDTNIFKNLNPPITAADSPAIISFYFRVDTPARGPASVIFRERGDTVFFLRITRRGIADETLRFSTVRAGEEPFADLASFQTNHWYFVEIQADIQNQRARARADSSSWSDWLSFTSAVTQIDRAQLQLGFPDQTINNDITAYFDEIKWEVPLSTQAANLAKQLVNSVYLLGGKGWDYNQDEFVAPTTVKTGYNFWNNSLPKPAVDFGAGVDCSGLIMWAYDRSFDPTKSRFNNFVKAEGADEQFRKNTVTTTESELQPGDAMFFDNVPKDGFIDHVAMYVGESGSFDVVNASNPIQGIVPVSKNDLKQLPKFVAFKRVISALPPAVLVSAHSPVDLAVTDPDGFTITPTTTVPSDEEYLREIPGVLYYSEMEKGTDGNPIDQVYSYTLKTGDYTIQVLPEPGTPPDATYTLDFSAGEQSITLAQDTSINQIPSEGYGITSSDIGALNTFIPVSIDIKPGSFPNSINLSSKGTTPVAIFGSNTLDVHQINLNSITLAGAPIKLKKNAQIMANYEDVDGDGFADIVIHIITEALQLTPANAKAELRGFLLDGREIKGSDSIRIVP